MWNSQPACPGSLLEFHLYCRHPFHPSGKTSSLCRPGLHHLPPGSPVLPGRAGGMEKRRSWPGFSRVSVNANAACGGDAGVVTGVTVSVSRKGMSQASGNSDSPWPQCTHPHPTPLNQTCSFSLVPHLDRWPTTCLGGKPNLGPIQTTSPSPTSRSINACLLLCLLTQLAQPRPALSFRPLSSFRQSYSTSLAAGLPDSSLTPIHHPMISCKNHSLAIHSFNQHLWSDSYVPGIMLGTG